MQKTLSRLGSFRKAPEPVYQRRRHDLNLARMTSCEIVALEESVDTITWQDLVKPFIPLIAW
jgi:hypothetical protein